MAILLCVAVNLLAAGLWHHRFAVNGPYRADGGFAWVSKVKPPLAGFVVRGDTRKNTQLSDLVLADHAGMLGPAHAAAADIRQLGGGRYSHWKNQLIFSTRDGKDPNVDPIGLTAMVTVRPQTWLLLLAELMGAGAAFILASRLHIFGRLERMPLVGWLPRQLRSASARVSAPLKAISRASYQRLVSRVSMALAFAMVALAGFAIVSQSDLIKVTEDINFEAAPPSLGVGHEFLVPRPSLYLPFVEIAPIETKPMTILIDGAAYPCEATLADVSALGQGRCRYSNTYVYVSAPDNATIMTDGRHYAERFPVRVHPYVIYLALALALFFGLGARYGTSSRRWLTLFAGAVLVAGAALTTANLAGMARSLRSPALATMTGFGPDGTRMAYEEATRQLDWRTDDTAETFSSRATTVISQTVSSEYLEKDFDDLHVHVPIWENWILQLMGLAVPELRDYTFWNPQKALERGVGQCGHVAAMLVAFLSQHGIDARVVGLTGHIVATAEIEPGRWYIFDPYNGVVIPHDLKALENDAQLIRTHYSPVITALGSDPASGFGKAMLDLYVYLYGTTEDNRIYVHSDADRDSGYAERERWAYRLKWPIPLAMMILGAVGLFIGYRRERMAAHT